MSAFTLSQQDYIYFIFGYILLVAAAMVWEMAQRSAISLKWGWVASFSLLYAVSIWLQMGAMTLGDTQLLHLIRIFINVVGGVFLFEFFRSGFKKQSSPVLGVWIYLPLLGLTALGGLASLDGLDAASRYVLAFPGALLSAWVTWRETHSPQNQKNRLPSLILIGLGMFVVLSTPRAVFFPASLINRELFFRESGEPITALWVIVIMVVAVSVLFIVYLGRKASGGIAWFQRWLIPVLITIFLIAGWWLVNWRGKNVDSYLREQLLSNAAYVAQTIQPDTVRQITFSGSDAGNPVYDRLSAQLSAFSEASGYHSIYTLAVRDGELIFGPESLQPGDVWASPPGTVYLSATPEDWQIFEDGVDFTEGPSTDEYGNFISALAAVTDPVTGEVLMAVGIDMDQTAWQVILGRERLLMILFILLNVVLLLAADILLFRRSQLPPEMHNPLRYIEVFLVFTAGIIYTAAGGAIAAENLKQTQESEFKQLSESQNSLIKDTLQDICYERLANLRSFFENSEYVNLTEFTNFTQPFIQDGIVQAWEWIPYVPAEEKIKFQTEAHEQGLLDYLIYELDDNNEAVPVEDRMEFYPVYYVSPLEGNQAALGFDIGSEPRRFSTLEEAAQTGLTTASSAITLVQETGNQISIFFIQPVYTNQGTQANLKGFVAAVIRMQSLLEHTLLQSHLPRELITIGLYKLETGVDPYLLASSSTDSDHLKIAQETLLHNTSELLNLQPLFLADDAFAIVTHPGEAFWVESRSNSIWGTILVGLTLTLISSAFTGFLSRYQANLRSQVRARTTELRRSEEKFAKAFHSSGVLMAVTDVGFGRYVDVNRAFCETMGFEREEMIGKTSSELSLQLEPVQYEDVFQEIREKGNFRDAEIRVRTRDGRIIYGLLSMDAISLDGKPHLLMSMLDITGRKQSEEALRTSQKYADLGTLAAGVAHELNTPLQIITGSADSLLRNTDLSGVAQPDRLKRYLENISRSAWRMSDIVRTLNIYARHNREDEDDYDLNELVRDTLVLMENQLRVWSNIQVEMALQEELPRLRCNRNDITQILINLISNGRDAMPTGGKICLATSYDEAEEKIILEVSDTGPGVPDEIREKIFNPFFTTKAVGKGTGLGLSIVLGITQHYGAHIAVYDAPEGGAVFRLSFPLRPKPDDFENSQSEISGRYT